MNNKKIIKGICLVLCGFIFAILETWYYDSNFFPNSFAELMCDLFSIILSLAGAYLILTSIPNEKEKKKEL